MAPVVVPGIDVPFLTGPLVLGYMWSYFLYGMLIVQLYLYSETFHSDIRGIKAFVWALFILETIFSIFTTIAAWNEYGPGWGDVQSLIIIDWSWVPLPALNSVLAAMAQSFYIWRISNLTTKRWVPILIGCVMLTHVTVSFYYGIRVTVEGRGITQLFALGPEITLWLSGSAACDLMITISLVVLLSYHKRRSTFQRTRGLINKMIRFSVETGCITSAGAVITLILWLTCHKWNWHFMTFLVLGKLYSNLLMATLNCRAPIFRSDAFGTNTTLPSSFWAEPANKAAHSSGHGGVHISHSTNVARDTDTIVMTNFSNSDPDTNGKMTIASKSQLVV